MKVSIDSTGYAYVLGVFAALKNSGLVVIKVYEDRKWDVVAEYIPKELDIEKIQKVSEKLICKYQIKQIFGNKLGRYICIVKDKFTNKGELYEGYEIVDLTPEETLFLVQGHIKRIQFIEGIKDNWEDELQKFDVDTPEVGYPRISGLASVIRGVDISISMFQ